MSNKLSELAAKGRLHVGNSQSAGRQSLAESAVVGEVFEEAKKLCGHGRSKVGGKGHNSGAQTFPDWLKNEFNGMTPQWANKLIALFRVWYPDMERFVKRHPEGHLWGVEKALRMYADDALSDKDRAEKDAKKAAAKAKKEQEEAEAEEAKTAGADPAELEKLRKENKKLKAEIAAMMRVDPKVIDKALKVAELWKRPGTPEEGLSAKSKLVNMADSHNMTLTAFCKACKIDMPAETEEYTFKAAA